MATRVILYNPSATMGRIVGNDDVGQYTAQTWGKHFAKYVPMKSGLLKSNYHTEPFKVIYDSPYSHYQWEGEKYNDPLINASGWYDANAGRWYSHKGIEKVPSGEPLHYSTEMNPNATSHWEEPAFDEFKKEVASEITEYIRRRG